MRIFILILSLLIPVQSFAGLPAYSPKVPLFVTKAVQQKGVQRAANDEQFAAAAANDPNYVNTSSGMASVANSVGAVGGAASLIAGVLGAPVWATVALAVAPIAAAWWLGTHNVDSSGTTTSNPVVVVGTVGPSPQLPSSVSSSIYSSVSGGISRGALSPVSYAAFLVLLPRAVGGDGALAQQTGLYPSNAPFCMRWSTGSSTGTGSLMPDSAGVWPTALCGPNTADVALQFSLERLQQVFYPAVPAYPVLYGSGYYYCAGFTAQTTASCALYLVPSSAPVLSGPISIAAANLDPRLYPSGSVAYSYQIPGQVSCLSGNSTVTCASGYVSMSLSSYGFPITGFVVVSPNPAYSGSHSVDIPSLVYSLRDLDLDMGADSVVLAHLVNALWSSASSAPGYQGVPFDAANPVTSADIDALKASDPQSFPRVRDLISPAIYPGTNLIPLSPDSLPSGVPRDAFNPVINVSPTVNVNVPPDPNIQAIRNKLEEPATAPADPTAKTKDDFLTALGPLDTALQPLSGWQLPAHSSTCPTWQFSAFGHTFNVDSHCQFAQDNLSWLSTVFMVLWNIGAVFVILGA